MKRPGSSSRSQRSFDPRPSAYFFQFVVVGWTDAKAKDVKKETKLGLPFKKDENFGDWYSDVSFRASHLNCRFRQKEIIQDFSKIFGE